MFGTQGNDILQLITNHQDLLLINLLNFSTIDGCQEKQMQNIQVQQMHESYDTDLMVQDGYLRIKQIQVGYNFKDVVQTLKLRKLRLYLSLR
jgi:hypothetical protein